MSAATSTPPSYDPAQDMRRTRKLVRVTTLAYLIFVIYGSLVPLDLRPIEMAEAFERFRQIPFLNLGIGSRADWVANLLLFIPLSYLFAASIWPSGRGVQIVTTIGIAIGCTVLSVAIEFTQIFFPPRTVSQNDIIAETLGGLLGLAAWWVWGQRSVAWLTSWRHARGAASLAEKLFWLYLLLLFGYNLLPLDLTISMVEIYHKWNEGRLNLIPFAATPGEPVRFLYEVVVDAVLWMPFSLLLTLSGRVSPRRAVLWTLVAAALLEAMQLLVYSRYSDVTDLITAVPGAFTGGWLAARLRPQALHVDSPTHVQGARIWFIAAMIVGWCLLLAAIFWYPFNFSRDVDLVRRGFDAFFQVPFLAYYFGSELRAITEVFHKVGFFIPLGGMLAWLRWRIGHRGHLRGIDAIPLLMLLGPPLVIELGQVALVDKSPGSTDLVLEWIGGIVGYVGVVILARRWTADAGPVHAPLGPPSARPHSPPQGTVAASSLQQPAHGYPPSTSVQLQAAYAPYLQARLIQPTSIPKSGDASRPWCRYLVALVVMTLVLWLVTSSERAPYNLRELTEKFPPPFGALGLLIAALIAFAPAALVGRMLSESRRLKPLVLSVLFGHPLLLYLALRVAIPLESIDDIIGSVRPSAIAELERLLRFAGLFWFVGTAVTGGSAAWFALRSIRPQRIVRWFLLGAMGFSIGYWAIVVKASTDNLIELIRGRGSLVGMIALYLWLWVTSFHAVLGVGCLKRTLSLPTCLMASVILMPLAYALFWVALEPHIVKYQQVFSAIQFLLSPDRENYIFGSEVMIRFLLMQLGLLLLMGLAFYPVLGKERLPNLAP